MKKTTLTLIALFALFASGCASRRQNVPSVFPRERATGYTDSLLIVKYLNVDTASFRRLEQRREIWRMSLSMNVSEEFWQPFLEEKETNIQRQRRRYPRTQIRDIEQAIQWLDEVYTNSPARPALFYLRYYKQVEDGFLVKGNSINTAIAQRGCLITRRWGVFLVGNDHNIVEINRWTTHSNRCTTEIDIQIHFPEFENADVRLPELLNHNLDSLLLGSMRYPATAIGMFEHGIVVVSFIVETDGEISNLEIVRSAAPSLGREVFRVVQAHATRQWIPGMKNGEKIPMEIQVEVQFSIR